MINNILVYISNICDNKVELSDLFIKGGFLNILMKLIKLGANSESLLENICYSLNIFYLTLRGRYPEALGIAGMTILD